MNDLNATEAALSGLGSAFKVFFFTTGAMGAICGIAVLVGLGIRKARERRRARIAEEEET